jgi:limonene-1,2-epoxide hydrolase
MIGQPDNPAQVGIGPDDASATPAVLVRRFLDLLAADEVDKAVDLLAEDVEYVNVGMPTIRGREQVRRIFQAMLSRLGGGFEVYMHSISADGASVLTERTDVLKFGPLRIQLWVCGRFDVHDGQIVLWRDYFDYVAFMVGVARGLLGIVLPAARARPPVGA